jgi:AcrR family transcriptional regulator
MARPTRTTREQFVDVAMRLFWEKGYGATSIADILQAAGANAGSLYYCFPTKQDLLIAVLRRYHAGIHPMLLAPAWDGLKDPIEKIFALLARYREALMATDCTYGCPIGSLALELHEPDPCPHLARRQFRRVDRRHRAVSQGGTRAASPWHQHPRAGVVHPDDDGRGRDAGAHPPRPRHL